MKVFKSLFIVFLSLWMSSVWGQERVSYLSAEPEIDGFADANLSNFALNEFPVVRKSSTTNPDIKAGYYIAYSERFLYLYIEAWADKLVLRDRAYQNGDGFHLMIGKPQPDGVATDEFFVLGFSPDKGWCHKMVWYYNQKLGMSKLSDYTRFATTEDSGKISFELLLPWSEVYPYNPLLSEKIGFNLCFVKAFGESEKSLYFIKDDNRLQSEQSKRKYVNLDFEGPRSGVTTLVFRPDKNTINRGEDLIIKLSGYNDKKAVRNLTVRILSGENSIVAVKNLKIEFEKGFSVNDALVESGDLIPGGYKIMVFEDNTLTGEQYISVLPDYSFKKWRESVNNQANNLSRGSSNTLMFYINNTEQIIKSQKDYECSFDVRYKIDELSEMIDMAEKGVDRVLQKRGYLRRAYLKADGSGLSPYSVYLPADYSPQRSYPLLVYLHGSGEDDRALAKTDLLPDGFIIVAPGGAGTSNCFATEEAQDDIEESVVDVISNYNIDTTRIILSGFSMGGYGVYRTYYEKSSRYCAIAIISGHPDLARKWVDENEISFVEETNLIRFKSVPIFIFHGKSDLNCPFELTEMVVRKLNNMGADVTFETNNSGHGTINDDIRSRYYSWLKKQLVR